MLIIDRMFLIDVFFAFCLSGVRDDVWKRRCLGVQRMVLTSAHGIFCIVVLYFCFCQARTLACRKASWCLVDGGLLPLGRRPGVYFFLNKVHRSIYLCACVLQAKMKKHVWRFREFDVAWFGLLHKQLDYGTTGWWWV